MNAQIGTRLAGIFKSLVVTDEHLGTRVAQRVVGFVFGPPRVHRHRHTTSNHNAGKGHCPLGVVAHGDGHPIAFVDAIYVDQTVGQGIHLLERFGKRPAFTFIHEEVFVAVPASQAENLGEVGWRVLKHRHLYPAHFGID